MAVLEGVSIFIKGLWLAVGIGYKERDDDGGWIGVFRQWFEGKMDQVLMASLFWF